MAQMKGSSLGGGGLTRSKILDLWDLAGSVVGRRVGARLFAPPLPWDWDWNCEREPGWVEGSSGTVIPAASVTPVGLSIYFSINLSLFQLKYRSSNDEISRYMSHTRDGQCMGGQREVGGRD